MKKHGNELYNLDQFEEPSLFPLDYRITSYGADFTVYNIVTLISRGDIYIPSFQRGYVWTHYQASRFIESLVLGLPVPGIFLAREYGSHQMLVIDGQQRLLTLLYFYRGEFENTGKRFTLRGVTPPLEGLTYQTLTEEQRYQLDDSIIHATIVQQESDSDFDSIYAIFERLNTGGTALSPQEIRSGVFDGRFNNLLRELNLDEAWRSIYGPISERLKDQELILRFFALYFESDTYRRPMVGFLNHFMQSNRDLNRYSEAELIPLFSKTIHLIRDSIGKNAFRPSRNLNAAVFDGVMVGIARRLKKGDIRDLEGLRERYHELLKNENFVRLTSSSTASEISVRGRIEIAIQEFQNVR